MFIARVRGNVVTTQKVETMTGRKLLIVEPLRVDEKQGRMFGTERCFVAVDNLGAGQDDLVLVTQGSSARMTPQTEKAPVDCVVIGIIDTVFADESEVYRKGQSGKPLVG
jgi:microcompartment protein CcmK/EutM